MPTVFDWFVTPLFIRAESADPLLNQLLETASALVYMKRNTILHGDVQAANVLIARDGHVRLCDYGLARVTVSNTSVNGQGPSKSRYQSPELWTPGANKTWQSDVYAFGFLIYEVWRNAGDLCSSLR